MSALQRELNSFLSKVQGLDYDIQSVTKGALSQARAKLKPEAFLELNQLGVKEFYEGAEKVLNIAKVLGVKKAILKSKSPSCGCGLVYDGTFSGKLIEGNGLTAELLIQNGIEVITEKDEESI